MAGRRGGDIWKTRGGRVRFFIVPEQPGLRKAKREEVTHAARNRKRFPAPGGA